MHVHVSNTAETLVQVTIDSYRSPSNFLVDTESQEQYAAGLEAFRKTVINSCAMIYEKATESESERTEAGHCLSAPVYFVISNFSRKVLGQTGDGHFSPIGG